MVLAVFAARAAVGTAVRALHLPQESFITLPRKTEEAQRIEEVWWCGAEIWKLEGAIAAAASQDNPVLRLTCGTHYLNLLEQGEHLPEWCWVGINTA